MSYRLSICIPTCNSDVYLERLLRHLFAQLEGLQSEIEVIVSDNASDDRTGEVASEYAARPNFRYVRRPENGGAERNFLNAVANASGEYVWLLGDDDVVLPGAIGRLLTVISTEPFDLAHFSIAQRKWVDAVQTFASAREYIEHFARTHPPMLYEATVISFSVFRRAAWDSVPDKERFIPTRYVHTLTMAEALMERGTIMLRPEMLIAMPRYRATVHDEKLGFEIYFLHLYLLQILARMSGSRTLKQYNRAERMRVLKHTAGDLWRLTKHYFRDAKLIGRSARRVVTSTGRVKGTR